jgi:hypothetical protein
MISGVVAWEGKSFKCVSEIDVAEREQAVARGEGHGCNLLTNGA